jgi:HSP20 family protein
MFALSRLNLLDEVFALQRDMERVFTRVWSELPVRMPWTPTPFNVNTTEDAWRIDVPLPGIDPKHVSVEAVGNTVGIRITGPGDARGDANAYQQSLTVPHVLDLDRMSATHEHGMLRLTLPLKESMKPRRIPIEAGRVQKQLAGAAA